MEPLNLDEYAKVAAEKLPPMVFDYFEGGSDDELTIRENRLAWQRIMLRPRVLIDVSQRDLSTSILGQPVDFPILTAPCGVNAMAHPDGELAVARATTAMKTLQIVSTVATYSLEDIADAAPSGLRWFQLYCFRDRGLTRALVDRAVAAGYSALCLTVDTPILGRRERDFRNQFQFPLGIRWNNLVPYMNAKMGSDDEATALRNFVDNNWDASTTWETVDWLRQLSPLPLVLKGILSPDDARLAVAHGAQGIVVSNHGGRQLDGAIPTAAALGEIVAAIGEMAEIYVDGGIRRGSDVLKALALGARAVLIGRPYLWGLAIDGQAGVRRVLELLKAELDLCMALSGLRTIQEIHRNLVICPDRSGKA